MFNRHVEKYATACKGKRIHRIREGEFTIAGYRYKPYKRER